MDWYPDDVVIWPTPSALETKVKTAIDRPVLDFTKAPTYDDAWSGNADTDKYWRNA